MTKQNSSCAPYCTAFVLSVAWGIGCACAVVLAASFYLELLQARSQAPSVPYEEIGIAQSGAPLILVGGSRNPKRILATDRTPIEIDDQLLAPDVKLPTPHLQPWYTRRYHARLDRQRIQPVSINDSSADWYFVVEEISLDRVRGQFVGYDLSTSLPAGYVGANGFRDAPIPPDEQFIVDPAAMYDWTRPGMTTRNDLQRFALDRADEAIGIVGDYPLSRSQLLFQAQRSAYVIDFARKTIDVALNDREVLTVGSVAMWVDGSLPAQENAPAMKRWMKLSLAARTPRSVIFFDPAQGESIEFPLPETIAAKYLTLYRTADDSLIALTPVEDSVREVRPGIGEYQTEYLRIARSGEIVERQTIARQFGKGSSEISSSFPMYAATLSIPGTLPSSVIGGYLLPLVDQSPEPESFAERVGRALGITWPAILVAALISAGLCRLVVRRQAEYRLPHRWGWIAFVFLLGIPGYLGYRFHRKWPVKHRPAPPARTGCEVFAA